MGEDALGEEAVLGCFPGPEGSWDEVEESKGISAGHHTSYPGEWLEVRSGPTDPEPHLPDSRPRTLPVLSSRIGILRIIPVKSERIRKLLMEAERIWP